LTYVSGQRNQSREYVWRDRQGADT
jgi:hypothetical protein